MFHATVGEPGLSDLIISAGLKIRQNICIELLRRSCLDRPGYRNVQSHPPASGSEHATTGARDSIWKWYIERRLGTCCSPVNREIFKPQFVSGWRDEERLRLAAANASSPERTVGHFCATA
jgi:hypothetical protein